MVISAVACSKNVEDKGAAAPSEKETKYNTIEVKEFGYSVDNGYLYYSICLHNNDNELCIKVPSFRITARDKDNVILGTTTEMVAPLYPQQDVWCAFQAFEVEDIPDTVNVEVLPPDDYNIKKASALEHPNYVPLTVVNSAKRGDKVVGEIKNENDYDIDEAVLTIVFRDADGKLLCGFSTFVESVPANGTAPFEKTLYDAFGEQYELYAANWS